MFPRIGFSRWLIGGMILALWLISGCTAPAQPTPTPPPTPTPAPTRIPTYTPTSTATATLEPTPNPTEIAAQATATAQAEQAIQAQAEIKHFQQAFEQLAKKYPDGYSGENLQISINTVEEVRGALGIVLWPTYRQLVQDFDPEGKILSLEKIEQFLKENPDASLVIAFRGKNVVYFTSKDSPSSAKFYPDWAEWFAVFSYDKDPDEIKIATKPVPLNEGGHSVLRFRNAAPMDILAGVLPTKQEEQYRRWTDWQIEGYILTIDGELVPVGGFTGHTKADRYLYNRNISLRGWAKPVTPEESTLLQDVDVVSLLNGE